MASPNGCDAPANAVSRGSSGSHNVDVAPSLTVELPAVAEASGLLRDRVRSWLDHLQWPADERNDITAAACEAVENVISHAYGDGQPGEVILTGRIERAPQGMRQAVLEIIDHGSWRPPPADPGDRGHGFKIMHASMASVRTFASNTGTRLEMHSRPVPA